MLILGLDFETTFGDVVDTTKALVIETGLVLWDTDAKIPVFFTGRIAWDEAREARYDHRITDLTGLSLEHLRTYGLKPRVVLQEVCDLMKEAKYVVAHNGNGFDRPVLEAEAARHGLAIPPTPWLDTSIDVPYPKKIETRKLDFLAPAHGFLNPFAHRALFDVLSMLKVLGQYDIAEVIERSAAPKVQLRALTKKPFGPEGDNGASNTVAKSLGFRFDGIKKWWVKTVLGFEVEQTVMLAAEKGLVVKAV